jgi:hypothetical protein
MENRIQAGRFRLLLMIGCCWQRWFWVVSGLAVERDIALDRSVGGVDKE